MDNFLSIKSAVNQYIAGCEAKVTAPAGKSNLFSAEYHDFLLSWAETGRKKHLSLFYNKTGEIPKVFYGKITIKS